MIEVWIDGCCYPVNPGGTACTGYVIKKIGITIAKGSKIVGEGKGMTNNVAEYHALVYALEEIHQKHLQNEPITIRSDSTLLVNQMKGNWKVKAPNLYPIYRKARKLASNLKISIEWIPRELNEEADELSREAFKNKLSQETCISEEKVPIQSQSYQSFLSDKQDNRIGETNNFCVDLDRSQKLVLLYEKNSLIECPIKLAFQKTELSNIINLLSKGKEILDNY